MSSGKHSVSLGWCHNYGYSSVLKEKITNYPLYHEAYPCYENSIHGKVFEIERNLR